MNNRLINYLIFAILVSTIAVAIFASGKPEQKTGAWVAPKSADTLVNKYQGNGVALAAGQQLFAKMCVTCHGPNGWGNGPASADLTPRPANLASAVVQKQSDGAIFWKISNGRGAMTAYQYSLSEKQRWELVTYIRQLPKQRRGKHTSSSQNNGSGNHMQGGHMMHH